MRIAKFCIFSVEFLDVRQEPSFQKNQLLKISAAVPFLISSDIVLQMHHEQGVPCLVLVSTGKLDLVQQTFLVQEMSSPPEAERRLAS